MVYKYKTKTRNTRKIRNTRNTRKINKIIYLQNRKSRRIYGGEPNDIMSKNNKEEIPTLMSNLKASGNLLMSEASNLAAKGIQSTAEKFGIEPNLSKNNMNDIGNKIGNISDALNSSEGEKLKQEASELLANSVEILKPSIKEAVSIGNELIQEEIPILGNMGNEAVLMIPGAGQVIGAVEEVGNVAQAAEAATKGLANLTTTGTETIQKIEDQKRKAESIWGRIKELANNISTGVNKTVSNNLASVQESVNKEGQNITAKNSEIPTVNIPTLNIPTLNTNNNYQMGGAKDSFKKLHKEALMVGGRSLKSHLDFLAPHVNRSQILRQYGGKTKRIRRRHDE